MQCNPISKQNRRSWKLEAQTLSLECDWKKVSAPPNFVSISLANDVNLVWIFHTQKIQASTQYVISQ